MVVSASLASQRLHSRQVLNFGSLANIVDSYSELHLLDEAAPVSNELLASPPPP
jgi:hypothetical protein